MDLGIICENRRKFKLIIKPRKNNLILFALLFDFFISKVTECQKLINFKKIPGISNIFRFFF